LIKAEFSQIMPHAPVADVAAIISAAHNDFLALRGSRIFMTGGTGYIGRWLLEALCRANRILNLELNVTVLSRQPRVFSSRYPHLSNDPAVSCIAGDVRHFHCEQKNGFTHIIHAATDVVVDNHPLDVLDVTIQGTRRVLDFAQHCGVRDVLLLSSGAVYGNFPVSVEHASESLACTVDVTTQRSAYGLGKIATEWLGNLYGKEYGFSCKSARIFAQIGPYLELGAQFAVGNFIRDALMGKSIIVKGDGTSLRSYMYATDLVVWLLAILVRGQAGYAYNVGSDKAISIKNLSEMIARISGVKDLNIQILGQTVLTAASSRYVPDTEFARNTLDIDITVSLEDAITRTMEWNRALGVQ